jgi:hypothetical protein
MSGPAPGEDTGPPTLEKGPPPEPAGADGSGGGSGSGRMRQAASAARYEPGGEAPPPAARFWSVRRMPAGLVALALVAACGLLLFDVASVRADRPATAWRSTLAEQLAERRLDDPWVVVSASLLVLIGLWLLLLAVTPGLRGLLPMRRDSEQLRAGIERHAAAQVLRDRAMDVSGVQSVRVTVGRVRVRVTARAHFRDLDDIRSDLDAVLEHTIEELGLARRPALSVQVSRPGKD